MKIAKSPIKKFHISDKITVSKGYKYQITDGNIIIGEIVVDHDLRLWMYCNDTCFFIDRYKVTTTPSIIDFATNTTHGIYVTKKYSSSGLMPAVIEVTFDDVSYTLTSIETDIKFNLIKPSSWGQFKFEFSCGDNKATYSFDIPQSVFSVVNNNPYVNRDFEGVIDNRGLTPFQIMLGMALVEKALYRFPPSSSNLTAGI